MTLVVVGRTGEVDGFALAGVRAVSCGEPAGAQATLEQAAAGAGLVLVTPWIAAHAGHVIQSLQRRKGPPVVTVMPAIGAP